MAKSEQIKNEEINYAEKAAEHIKLQEQFAERVGESYWRVRQKRIELTGFRERQAEIIRQKIAKLDELLTGVDWQAEDARKKLEENFGVREKIEKEEKAFTEIQKLMNELAARENELVRENFDVRRIPGSAKEEGLDPFGDGKLALGHQRADDTNFDGL